MDVPPNTPPSVEAQYRPLTLFAKATTLLFVMYAAACALLAVTAHQMLGHLRTPEAERDFDAIEALASRVESFESLLYAVYAGCVLTFCLWTYRLMANARLMTNAQMTSPGWAVGYYFIPIINLWKPAGAVLEAWRASEPAPVDGHISTSRGVTPAIITAWWLTFIGSRIFTRLVDRMAGDPDDFESIKSALEFGRYAVVAELVAVVFALMMVWKVTRRLEQRAQGGVPAAQALTT